LIGRWLFPNKLSKVIINVTIKFLAGELEGEFVQSDRENFSTWGFVKATYQRCNVLDKDSFTVRGI